MTTINGGTTETREFIEGVLWKMKKFLPIDPFDGKLLVVEEETENQIKLNNGETDDNRREYTLNKTSTKKNGFDIYDWVFKAGDTNIDEGKAVSSSSGLHVLPSTMKDAVVVITGTLTYTRSHYETIITNMGGINGRGMTKKTDFLIVGVNSGSKLAKAKALGTAIIGEKEFLAVYG